MYSNHLQPPIRERRGAPSGLNVHVNQDGTDATLQAPLPPLKSPRGHLLDRIRSTPRSSKFVPHGASDQSLSMAPAATQSHRAPVHQQSAGASPNVRVANMYTPQRKSSNSQSFVASPQKHDLAKADQLAMLEQQLRAQNDLLSQQQMLLSHLQNQQQQQQQQQYQPALCATPPYTPQSAYSRHQKLPNNVVYDPSTGQYYMFAPQQSIQPQFNLSVTPAQKARHNVNTPESMSRAMPSSKSPTPSKEGQPSRQPQGPPGMDLLLSDVEGIINFAGRTRLRAKQILEAGLLRRRSSPPTVTDLSRPVSRASLRSTGSLGPIEEAFPAITL